MRREFLVRLAEAGQSLKRLEDCQGKEELEEQIKWTFDGIRTAQTLKPFDATFGGWDSSVDEICQTVAQVLDPSPAGTLDDFEATR
jgi:hypothetical protein